MIKSHPPQWSNYYFLHGHGVLTQFFYCNYGARDLVSYPLRMAYSIYAYSLPSNQSTNLLCACAVLVQGFKVRTLNFQGWVGHYGISG